MKTIKTKVEFKTLSSGSVPVRDTAAWYAAREKSKGALLALIPVYNTASHLTATLDSLVGVVDGVVILDDGSTDNSVVLAKEHPLTWEILLKPPKPLSQWDDARNRYELYLAAEKYDPAWVICIDGDETVDIGFRLFVHSLMADYPACRAFAFDWIDVDNDISIRERFCHRMYRYALGYRFDSRRLHCRLIPLDITPEEVSLVNLKIYHNADSEARKARYEKYLQADSERQCQSSYEHLKSRLISNPIGYDYSGLKVQPIKEDGLQRSLLSNYGRYIFDFGQDQLEALIQVIKPGLPRLLDLWKFFLQCKLDAFHIKKDAKGAYTAAYAYDTQFEVPLDIDEVVIIEEMKKEKNFPLLFAKVWMMNKCRDIGEAEKILGKHLQLLIKKKILK